MTTEPDRYNCKVENCRKPAVHHVVYGCLNSHVADTEMCTGHLGTVKDLTADSRWRCYSCGHPVIAGVSWLIRSKSSLITVYRFDGTVMKVDANPEYGHKTGNS